MICYLLKKDSMGGCGWHPIAFVDRHVSELVAEELKEEWVSYKPMQFDGEEINGDRIIVNGVVYRLSREDAVSKLRSNAMKKLTKAEKIALGLFNP